MNHPRSVIHVIGTQWILHLGSFLTKSTKLMVRIFWHISFPTGKKANLLTSDIGQRLGGREICQKMHNNQGSPPQKKNNRPAISYQPIVVIDFDGFPINEIHFPTCYYHLTCLPAQFWELKVPVGNRCHSYWSGCQRFVGSDLSLQDGWFWEGDAVWIYTLDV